MSIPYSSSTAHNATSYQAELTCQNAIAAATTQAAINAAVIAYHRTIAKSAIANGVSPEVSMSALRALGVTGL
jgi:hypothetical protein